MSVALPNVILLDVRYSLIIKVIKLFLKSVLYLHFMSLLWYCVILMSIIPMASFWWMSFWWMSFWWMSFWWVSFLWVSVCCIILNVLALLQHTKSNTKSCNLFRGKFYEPIFYNYKWSDWMDPTSNKEGRRDKSCLNRLSS